MSPPKDSFKRFLKGHITASIIKTLLSDAGYQVIPFGVENVLRELSYLNADEYIGVAEHLETVRFMPDFFVLDAESNTGKLVEVKYRASLKGYSGGKLVEGMSNYKNWLPIHLILFLNDTTGMEWGTEQLKHIRVFEITQDELELMKRYPNFFGFRSKAKTIQEVFPKLGSRYIDQTIKTAEEAILSAIRGIEAGPSPNVTPS